MGQILANWNRNTTLIATSMIQYSKFMLIYADFFKNYNASVKKINLLLNTNE